MFNVEFKAAAITMACGLILGYAIGQADVPGASTAKVVPVKPAVPVVETVQDRFYTMQSVKYNCVSGIFWANKFSYSDDYPARMITVEDTGEFYTPEEFLEKNGPCIPIDVGYKVKLSYAVGTEVADWAKKVNTPVSKG